MRVAAFLAACAVAGCLVESGKEIPVPKGTAPIQVGKDQSVSIDTARVPVIDTCAAGQVVRRSASGWECADQPFAPLGHTHADLSAAIAATAAAADDAAQALGAAIDAASESLRAGLAQATAEIARLSDAEAARAAEDSDPIAGSDPIAFGATGTVAAFDGIPFGRTFATVPATVITVRDIAGGGAMEARILERTRSGVSVAITCNGASTADRAYWLAVEQGVHVVDGRVIQAGTSPSGGTSAFSVNFWEAFPIANPVVLVTADDSSETVATYATACRVTSINAAGFNVQCSHGNAIADGVHWIALAPTGKGTPIRIRGHTLQAGTNDWGTATVVTDAFTDTADAFSTPPTVIVASILRTATGAATSVRIQTPVSATRFTYRGHVCSGTPAAGAADKLNWVAID